MKKLISLALSVLMLLCTAVSLVGCGGDDEYSDRTVIEVVVKDGGFGKKWLEQSAARYEAAVATKSFEDGKTGVKIKVAASDTFMNDIASSGYVLLQAESGSYVDGYASQKYIANIHDWVTEANPWNNDKSSIDSYITETAKYMVKTTAADEYYGVPGWEWYGGLAYDRSLFEENNWFIAAQDDNYENEGHEVEVTKGTKNYGTLYLVNNANSVKSCGRDGIYGTTDDGLPTTLQEFATLCILMQNEGVDVFTLPGKWKYHSGYFYEALWAALAGSYDSDGNFNNELRATNEWRGTVEAVKLDSSGNVVTTDQNIFYGNDNYKMPETETVVITKNDENLGTYDDVTNNYTKTGNAAFRTAARYYAAAFFKFMSDEGLYKDADNTGISHTDAQYNFIFSNKVGKRRAFLIDGTYMYTEATEANSFKQYEDYYTDTEKVRANYDIQWYTLPAKVSDSVSPLEDQTGEGNKQALINSTACWWVVNQRFVSDPDLAPQLAVAKDFLQFISSKTELANHTAYSTNVMSYNYELTDEQYNSLPEFGKTVWNLHKSAEVVHVAAPRTNTNYNTNRSRLSLSCHVNGYIYFYQAGTTHSDWHNIYQAAQGNNSLNDIFTSGCIADSEWTGIATYDPTNQ